MIINSSYVFLNSLQYSCLSTVEKPHLLTGQSRISKLLRANGVQSSDDKMANTSYSSFFFNLKKL